MALSDRKITSYEDSIASLSDTPSSDGVTAAQLKAMFDSRTDNEVKDSINGIVDDLVSTTEDASGASQIGIEEISGIDADNVQDALVAIANGGAQSNLFWVAYGTTTYTQISTAISSNKLPLCIKDNLLYVYAGIHVTNTHCFVSVYNDTCYILKCDNTDAWSNTSVQLVTKATFDSNKIAWDAKQSAPTKLTLTLDKDDWSSLTQTVTATGVTATNLVEVSPVSASDANGWSENKVWCSAQGADSLTFVCAVTPDADISVNVVIWG